MPQATEQRPVALVFVYGCERCTDILAFLETYQVPYALIDIERDLEASMLVADANRGQFVMPVVQIGDNFYAQPTVAQLAARLGVDHLQG